jgi:hypothetical protein
MNRTTAIIILLFAAALEAGGDAVDCGPFSALYLLDKTNGDDLSAGTSRRVLRLGTRPIGSLFLCRHCLDAASVNVAASLAAVAIERL